jgi:hypothetical protein
VFGMLNLPARMRDPRWPVKCVGFRFLNWAPLILPTNMNECCRYMT